MGAAAVESWSFTDFPPNHHQRPTAPIFPPSPNLDKDLPPMPRLSTNSQEIYGDEAGERRPTADWIDIDSESEPSDVDLEYLRSQLPSFAAVPIASTQFLRGSIPTPTEPATVERADIYHTKTDSSFLSVPPSQPMASSPISASQQLFTSHSPLLRSVSEGEGSFLVESPPTRSFARPPRQHQQLPDPAHFPDPYPFRPPNHHLISGLPALSSADSSSASTRSSAYTNSGSALASGDYGHIHVASGDDEVGVAVGITSDDVVQLMTSDSAASSLSQSGTQSRVPIDQARWSDYSASIRSRSSSVGHSKSNSMSEVIAPRLSQKPSYDMNWESVDERDEAELMSEEETDDDHGLEEDLGDEDEEEQEEDRTAAVVIAEEGRGHIVRGDGVPIVQLHVEPGTTHLLVGSSSTPNAVPTFLANTLPQISNTLLALDISANFLVAVPPALVSCSCLEELNIASNPLRVIPVFLSHLTSLRVLIADSTGISTLPESFTELDKLHTLSVRRNKMNALPSWLCLLFSLQTLYVDGNPFQGPWKALTEPLLAQVPMTPAYPPSTPVFPLPSASITSSTGGTDESDFSDPPTAEQDAKFTLSPEEEDTITPEKSAFLNRAVPHMVPFSNGRPELPQDAPRLTRTRTTPNRAAYSNSRADRLLGAPGPSPQQSIYKAPGERELRKMKSAGELRPIGTDTYALSAAVPRHPPMGTRMRPSLTQYGSGSSSNLLHMPESDVPPVIAPKRFASLGATAALSAASSTSSSRARSNTSGSRTALTQSLWENASESEDDPTSSPESKNKRASGVESPPDARHHLRERSQTSPGQNSVDRHSMGRSKDGKERGRWGFLKKMSMGKMRIDTPTSSGRSTPMNKSISEGPTPLFRPDSYLPSQKVSSPRIDVRFSTTGTLGNVSSSSVPLEQHRMSHKSSTDALKVTTHPPSSSNLLAPPTPTSPISRAAKRRSFLPIDTPLPINIPTPSNFMPGVTASGEDDIPKTPVSAPDPAELTRREEENMRDSSARALRAVMAYLKDMNDLNQSSTPSPVTHPVSTSDEVVGIGTRSRRPTIIDSGRGTSDSAVTQVQSSGSFGQLRPTETIAGMRHSNPMQTLSTATSDSNGSGEERKYKDDKAKRAMVVREIVETERTYVKGLEELVDLYIKPGAASVNMLSGVGSSKDTVVPISERKIVFNGLDSLFSFHKESFLPALEVAARPVMASASALQEVDADGQLSLKVVKDVAGMFIKHAAFMKMYSSYINNFDNSLQRVKYWSTKEGSSNQVTPASSTAQLVGFGLTMSTASNPGMTDSNTSSANGVANLSTSQKKRVRSYLKRCRMNPRHSQLNLEGYLLLPVQRIPRYKLLLEELLRSTPPSGDYVEDPLEKALAEISSLANNMNEGKRESESRRKLVQWQARIRGRFPSPLVQPHRRLIMDGPLLLTRVVRKAVVSFEAINALGDASTVQVDCLAPELTPRSLVGILCNDLLVLCRDPSEGKDTTGPVDLWAVLRMQTLPQPASIVHGNALRLVDNKAILYFDAPSPSDALNWFRAINLHIPASKS